MALGKCLWCGHDNYRDSCEYRDMYLIFPDDLYYCANCAERQGIDKDANGDPVPRVIKEDTY